MRALGIRNDLKMENDEQRKTECERIVDTYDVTSQIIGFFFLESFRIKEKNSYILFGLVLSVETATTTHISVE